VGIEQKKKKKNGRKGKDKEDGAEEGLLDRARKCSCKSTRGRWLRAKVGKRSGGEQGKGLRTSGPSTPNRKEREEKAREMTAGGKEGKNWPSRGGGKERRMV